MKIVFKFYNLLSINIILDILGDTSSDYFLRTYSKHSVTAVTRHNVPSYLLLKILNISFQILHILRFFHIRGIISSKVIVDVLTRFHIQCNGILHLPPPSVLDHFFDFYKCNVQFVSISWKINFQKCNCFEFSRFFLFPSRV